MSPNPMHLWPEEPTIDGEDFLVNITLETPSKGLERLWYRLPAIYKPDLAPNCDPYVIGTLFIAMYYHTDLVVHGAVSPSLLRNLEEFQMYWHNWKPEQYSPVHIIPEVESEARKANHAKSLVAFSGGLDSCFTVLRHHAGGIASKPRNLTAGLFLHGFDIPLRNRQGYQRALANTRLMLASVGLETIPMATNLKKLHPDWNDAHGAILASCLSLLSGGYTAGLIASSLSYSQLVIPYGSNPLSDRMLSSRAFEIVHDGAGYIRSDKIPAIAAWPEALENLRVCLVGVQKDRNCCRCEKCIRTILAFRAWGLGRPACFEEDLSFSQILRLKLSLPILISQYEKIIAIARTNDQTGSWMGAVKIAILLNRVYLTFRRITWLRKLIRNFRLQ